MHAASVVALTIYDMLKPIDKEIEISSTKLLKKKGGKSQYNDILNRTIKTAVVVCSDSISAGTKQDFAGKAIITKLEKYTVAIDEYSIIADEKELIQSKTKSLCADKYDLIIFTGGTGLRLAMLHPKHYFRCSIGIFPALPKPRAVTVCNICHMLCYRAVLQDL